MTLIIENSGAFVVWCNDLVTHKEGATFTQDWIVKTLHLFLTFCQLRAALHFYLTCLLLE